MEKEKYQEKERKREISLEKEKYQRKKDISLERKIERKKWVKCDVVIDYSCVGDG